MPKFISVIPEDNYHLRIVIDNGDILDFSVFNELKRIKAYDRLHNIDFFKQVKFTNERIFWDDDHDFHIDQVVARSQKISKINMNNTQHKPYPTPSFENKIIHPNQLLDKLPAIKKHSPIVFTNGCFDIIHRGHVTYLAQARALGSVMIVALNTDQSVKRLNKSPSRPINTLDNRLSVIASLESVDFVTYFDEDTPLKLIKQIMPDILVKGGDWNISDIVGSDEIIANGGSVYSIPFIYDTSTTNLINKIIQTDIHHTK